MNGKCWVGKNFQKIFKMSWFVEISEKAENILNSIDKNAAFALSKQRAPKTSKLNESFNPIESENTSLT